MVVYTYRFWGSFVCLGKIAWSTQYYYIQLPCMDYQNTQQTSPDFLFFEHVFSLDLRGQNLSQRLESLKPSEEFANQCFFFVLLEVNIILGLRTKTNLRTSILKEMFQTLGATSNNMSQSVHMFMDIFAC